MTPAPPVAPPPTTISLDEVDLTSEDAILAWLGAQPDDTKRAVLIEAKAEVQRNQSIWRGGIEPLWFDEFCVKLDGCPLFPRQHAVMEKTGLLDPRTWIKEGRVLSELVLMYGKGAGKDYISAKIIAYLAYVVLHIKDAGVTEGGRKWADRAEFFGLAPNSQLSIVNVAPNQDHARRVFFRYLSGFLKKSIFKEFNPEILTDTISFFTEEEKRVERETHGRVKAQPWLALYSLHSKATGFDGMNMIGWVMDEADDFIDTEARCVADLLHQVLVASCVTRVSGRWIGIVISYPRTESGFMQSHYAESKATMERMGVDTPVYADMGATWEINTKVSRNDPIIQRAYDHDPTRAASMYECVGMPAENAFFEFPEKIVAAVDNSRQPCAYFETEFTQEGNQYYISAKVSNIVRTAGCTYFLSGDSGRSGDSYALSVFHVDDQFEAAKWLCPRCGANPDLKSGGRYELMPWNAIEAVKPGEEIVCGTCWEPARVVSGSLTVINAHVGAWWKAEEQTAGIVRDAQGNPYTIGTIYEDLIVRIKPVKAQRVGEVNRVVSFLAVQDVCLDLMNGLQVYSARFDTWQTVQLREMMNRIACGDVDEISMSNTEQYRRARLAKMLLYENLLVLLPNPERDIEWRRLQLVNGTKIDHPQGGSKDYYDCEAIGIWQAATYKDSRLNVLFS